MPHSGWPVTAHTSEWMEEIKERILVSPFLSVRKLASHMHGSQSSVYCTLCGLYLHLYCILFHQEFKLPNYENQLCFCQWFQNFTHSDIHILYIMFFIGGVWMHLDEYINAGNFWLRTTDNLRVFVEDELHLYPQKLGLVCDFQLLCHQSVLFLWNHNGDMVSTNCSEPPAMPYFDSSVAVLDTPKKPYFDSDSRTFFCLPLPKKNETWMELLDNQTLSVSPNFSTFYQIFKHSIFYSFSWFLLV